MLTRTNKWSFKKRKKKNLSPYNYYRCQVVWVSPLRYSINKPQYTPDVLPRSTPGSPPLWSGQPLLLADRSCVSIVLKKPQFLQVEWQTLLISQCSGIHISRWSSHGWLCWMCRNEGRKHGLWVQWSRLWSLLSFCVTRPAGELQWSWRNHGIHGCFFFLLCKIIWRLLWWNRLWTWK